MSVSKLGQTFDAAGALLAKAAVAADAGNLEVAFYLSGAAIDVMGAAREAVREAIKRNRLQAVMDTATATGSMDPVTLAAAAAAAPV